MQKLEASGQATTYFTKSQEHGTEISKSGACNNNTATNNNNTNNNNTNTNN